MYDSNPKNMLHRLNLNMHENYSFIDNLDSIMVSNIRVGDKCKIFSDKFMVPLPKANVVNTMVWIVLSDDQTQCNAVMPIPPPICTTI